MPDDGGASISVSREELEGRLLALVATGELDMSVASSFESQLDPEGLKDAAGVVVDLSGVAFIDSSGIRVVATRLQELEQAGIAACAVVEVDSPVERAMELSGMNELLALEHDRESAIRRLNG